MPSRKRPINAAPPLADISPMLLGERKAPFSDPDWLFSLKMDGYRLRAEADAGKVLLLTRGGADATRWFPEVVEGLRALPPGRHITDGEVCVLDSIGRSDFDLLHARAKQRGRKPGSAPVVYCVFDLLCYYGRNVMSEPLEVRQQLLEELWAGKPPSTLFLSSIPAKGEWLYQHALTLKLEGIVAKRLGTPYQAGERSGDWLKIRRPGAVPAQRFKRSKV
jgi:bifunctional non-homologous end joining protein LigD